MNRVREFLASVDCSSAEGAAAAGCSQSYFSLMVNERRVWSWRPAIRLFRWARVLDPEVDLMWLFGLDEATPVTGEKGTTHVGEERESRPAS